MKLSRRELEFQKGQHGPKPVTGKFDSREELERVVANLMESGLSQNKIAVTCEVACATVNNIVKKLRAVELTKANDVKRAVLRGEWKNIPKIVGEGNGNDGVVNVADSDVSTGECDGVSVRECDAGDVVYRQVGRPGKNPFAIEIPAPGYNGKETQRY